MIRKACLFGVLTIACGLLVVSGLVVACDKGSSVGAAPGAAQAVEGSDRTVSKGALTQKGGLCNEERTVSNPDPDSPEWVIWRLYQLALGEDTPANFQAFVQLFPSSRNPRELKEMYWGRMRSTVHKFTTVKPGTPDFVICRSMPVDDGRKYYVVTSDPRQTPPPITVGEVEGKQKIVFLTPF
jgi:hypothetical protein